MLRDDTLGLSCDSDLLILPDETPAVTVTLRPEPTPDPDLTVTELSDRHSLTSQLVHPTDASAL
eukprot:CAMPEP_0184301880 /NCGR_PEP_ID=MMETSP1049-20130417/11989_1 /TAXON_ID=77928 /ORGANISM="Proteomonas sulcata, Strain CCMP704" /LENGTH=63 /DNA_ID=CAMNT_0026613009 /DNA_START=316 /DNA_END=507 /DNA_ORIENTATION=+